MIKDQAEFDRQLKALARSYAHRLREQLVEIQDEWRRMANDCQRLSVANTMQQMVHTMAGSAATFGFPKVSDVARSLDVLLAEINDEEIDANAEVRRKIEVLLAELTHAISRS